MIRLKPKVWGRGCFPLSDDYYKTNNAIVEQQLKSGGVRLAGLLNSILK